MSNVLAHDDRRPLDFSSDQQGPNRDADTGRWVECVFVLNRDACIRFADDTARNLCELGTADKGSVSIDDVLRFQCIEGELTREMTFLEIAALSVRASDAQRLVGIFPGRMRFDLSRALHTSQDSEGQLECYVIHVRCADLLDSESESENETPTSTGSLAELDHYRKVFESLGEALFMANADGVIEYVNARMCELTARSRESLLGRDYSDVFDADFDSRGQVDRWQTTYGSESGRYLNTLVKNGVERIWVEISLTSIIDEAAATRGSVGVLTDVTGRVRAELELRQSEENFRQLVRNAPVAVTKYLLEEHRYEYVNQEFERQCGYTLKEYEALTPQELVAMIHEADRERIFAFFKEWQAQGYIGRKHINYRIINRNNELRWLDTYLYADVDENDSVYALNQICVDISELKRAQDAVEDSLTKDFRRTIENLQNLVFKLVRTADDRYAYMLREGKLAGEFTSQRVKGYAPDEVFGEAHRLRVGPFLDRAFAGESVTFELEFDGQWLFYALEPVNEGGSVREVVGSAVNITGLKEVEHLLRDSEERNRVLVDAVPVAIMQMVEKDGIRRFSGGNQAFVRQTGYTPEEFSQFNREQTMNLYHPDDRDRVNDKWDKWFQEDSAAVLHETYRFRHKSGAYRWLEMYATRYQVESGERYYIQVALDVTEKKAVEERLRALASFPEQNPNPIIEIRKNGEVVYRNRVAYRHFPDLDEQGFAHPVLNWLVGRVENLTEAPDTVIRQELEHEHIIYELSVSYLSESDIIRMFCHIITEQKQAELHLRKALETERELNLLKTRFVSTVSHEFRTPLTGILSSAEMLERYVDRMDVVNRLEEVRKIKNRVTELTHLMDDFLLQSSLPAVGESLNLEFVDVRALCVELLDHLRSNDPKATQIESDFSEDVPWVRADEKLLRQVIKNLLSNAIKYSDNKHSVQLKLCRNEDQVNIKVMDRGIGIPQTELDRLFTPFFRASNSMHRPGTGIGLSIVKDFVELHKGTIAVESKEGEGSTFTVCLPIGA